MTEDIVFDYDVKCRTCNQKFKVQMFDSHDRNLYLVDNKHWFCDKCKKDFFSKQTAELQEKNTLKGFLELEGSDKSISWAEKLRSEMMNKFEIYKQTVTHQSDEDKELFEKANEIFLSEWFATKDAKWWIDNKKMNVRDMRLKIEFIIEEIKNPSKENL
ncbi:MAG: hypothetical protein GY714_24145 [Desulfobacterales bacterium]|nr:hypothetical protein [Desulfobacterales bacterium]MCP4163908.1 hypothetical protein [Deltaproteobacteria bacterium]